MQIRSKKIARNAPCPCGSKKKFKRCHGGVHEAPILAPGQVDSHLRRTPPDVICMAPGVLHSSCRGRPIASHTVSRSGSLGEIARSGHVYSYVVSIQRLVELNGRLEPKLTGWKQASTFPGFCSHHDKQIFAPLEDQPFQGNGQQCFLLGYRATAWEYYAKLNAAHHNDFRRALSAQRGTSAQNLNETFNFTNDLGFQDLRVRKSQYDEALVKGQWSDLHGLLIEFDRVFPIQCSAAWSPTNDTQGLHLQDLGETYRTPAGATVASFAANGRSYFLLSWFPDSDPVVARLADSIVATPASEIAGTIAALLLLTTENCHMAPDWYDGLPKEGKDLINCLALPVPLPQTRALSAEASKYLSGIGISSMKRF